MPRPNHSLAATPVHPTPPSRTHKVKKQKIWEAMSADLKTDASGAATWKGVHISVPSAPGGLFTVPACVDSPIA